MGTTDRSWSDISIETYAGMWKEGELKSPGRTISEWRAQMCRDFHRPDNEEKNGFPSADSVFTPVRPAIRICSPGAGEEEYFA